MTIKLLSPLVANQIAAGEVVERPSSVVKELAENSLDAGADRIEIEVEQGGRDLIRIRDNGSGIPKDELLLALKRHATSKISEAEDLNDILSFGFRGEALASISSVARLKLISKPSSQSQAWQIVTAGSEDSQEISPSSHPDGTTVEIRDLFFNVPARRRFLRSARTEMSHIQDFFRRLALSHPAIALVLKSDGHIVYSLPSARNAQQEENRLAQLLGRDILRSRLTVKSERDGCILEGFIVPPPEKESTDPEIQYFTLNGRMIKDRGIVHAIRQAYGECFGEEVKINYVLGLIMNPSEVDVNVHPAKHEVRFADARFIHDFVMLSIRSVLDEKGFSNSDCQPETTHDYEGTSFRNEVPEINVPDLKNNQEYSRESRAFSEKDPSGVRSIFSGSSVPYYAPSGHHNEKPVSPGNYSSEKSQFKAYSNWMKSSVQTFSEHRNTEETASADYSRGEETAQLYGVSQGYALVGFRQRLYAVNLPLVDEMRLCRELPDSRERATLMIPQDVKVDGKIVGEALDKLTDETSAGFVLIRKNAATVSIAAFPGLLRGYDLASLVSAFLHYFASGASREKSLFQVLATEATSRRSYTFADAVELICYRSFSELLENTQMIRELKAEDILQNAMNSGGAGGND